MEDNIKGKQVQDPLHKGNKAVPLFVRKFDYKDAAGNAEPSNKHERKLSHKLCHLVWTPKAHGKGKGHHCINRRIKEDYVNKLIYILFLRILL